MKKKIFITNLILLFAILVMDVLYITLGGLLIKSIASALFVFTGIVNLFYCIKNKVELKFPIWLVCGLVFAMLGDILLEIEFIVGAALFAIGHVLYFVSYSKLRNFSWKDLIYGICIFIPSLLLILLLPVLEFESILMKIVCCIYALIISFMVGKAASNFV